MIRLTCVSLDTILITEYPPRIMPRPRRIFRRCAIPGCRRRAYSPDELCDTCVELVPDAYLEAPPGVQAEVVRLLVRRVELARSWERVTGEPPRLAAPADLE